MKLTPWVQRHPLLGLVLWQSVRALTVRVSVVAVIRRDADIVGATHE